MRRRRRGKRGRSKKKRKRNEPIRPQINWWQAWGFARELWSKIEPRCKEFEPQISDRFRFIYRLENYPPRFVLAFEALASDKRFAEVYGDSLDKKMGRTAFRRNIPDDWKIEAADFIAVLAEDYGLRPRRVKDLIYELRPNYKDFAKREPG